MPALRWRPSGNLFCVPLAASFQNWFTPRMALPHKIATLLYCFNARVEVPNP